MSSGNRVRISEYQSLEVVRGLLAALDGTPAALLSKLWRDIQLHIGSDGNPADWSDPDTWIDAILPADTAALARRIWSESNHAANPRYLSTPKAAIRHYELATIDADGIYRLTESGRSFLRGDKPVWYRIDDNEGTLFLLNAVARHPGVERSELLLLWKPYLAKHSTMPDRGALEAMRRRLRDLASRALVDRSRGAYTITEAGLDWLGSAPTGAGAD